jgi:hypothetical protein
MVGPVGFVKAAVEGDVWILHTWRLLYASNLSAWLISRPFSRALGLATAVVAGKGGNIATLTINAVYGTALYVRNLTAFSGGADAYSVTVQLPRDKQAAIDIARAVVASQQARIPAILANPCREDHVAGARNMIVTWRCQFLTYRVPTYMHVTAARLSGQNVLVDVVFLPRPKSMIFR